MEITRAMRRMNRHCSFLFSLWILRTCNQGACMHCCIILGWMDGLLGSYSRRSGASCFSPTSILIRSQDSERMMDGGCV